MRLGLIFALAKDTFKEWNDDKASRLAAALAYYTVFSLPAFIMIVIAIAGAFLGEEAARGQVVAQLQGLIGREGASAIEAMITSAHKSSSSSVIASIISAGVLIFGATAVVIQLQDALNTIWEVTPKAGSAIKSFIFNRLLSFGMVLSVGFLLLVSLVLSAALALLSKYLGNIAPQLEAVWAVVDFAISLVVVAGLFGLMFKYLPDAKIAWSDVAIGALLTSLLFNLGKYLIGIYLGKSAFGSTYGTAGSLVVLLAWIYYSAQIFFLGAEFTQVYSRRYGSRIVPKDYAEGVTQEAKAQQGIVPKGP